VNDWRAKHLNRPTAVKSRDSRDVNQRAPFLHDTGLLSSGKWSGEFGLQYSGSTREAVKRHNVNLFKRGLLSHPCILTMLPSTALTGVMTIRRSPQVFMPLLSSAIRRRIATGPTIDKLSSKGTREPLHKGAEGPHISTCCPVIMRACTHFDAEDLMPSPTTSTQQINGDWVLFHPVYTPEELKAVEVSGRRISKCTAVMILRTGSPQDTSKILRQDCLCTSQTIPVSSALNASIGTTSNSMLSRWSFDFVSGYRHKPTPPGSNMSLEELRKGGYVLDERQWLTVRSLCCPPLPCEVQRYDSPFSANSIPRVHRGGPRNGCCHPAPPQESPSHGMFYPPVIIIYCPVLTFGQRRDSGWIHTLLEEAENERMHLMSVSLPYPRFPCRHEPLQDLHDSTKSWYPSSRAYSCRSRCLLQRLLYAFIFARISLSSHPQFTVFSYIISPRTCHRFVGHLEEEAVITYTRAIEELERGHLPKWYAISDHVS
jgi:ubiquinol oxidase